MSATIDRARVGEYAALRHAWKRWWARSKQIIPEGNWRSYGALTARGWGKTASFSEFVVEEVLARRARRIALIAQSDDKTREVMVEGESGLINTSPPRSKPELIKGVLTWPNGAQAFLYTPEPPGHEMLRGPEHDLAWASEFVAWPAATREEAFSNLRYGLRLGYGRMVWDSTPKRRHPLIRYLLNRAAKHPRHIVVRGTMYENADNLTEDLIDELVEAYGGTRRGLEELEGVFLDEDDGALWKQSWIDNARRDAPDTLARRVISIDPAISTKKGTDNTGLVDLGLGVDGQVYVFGDHTGKHSADAWGKLAIELYLAGECDCVVVERNRGGDLVLQNLRACADRMRIAVSKVEAKAKTRHDPEMVLVKEMTARDSKETRHEPVASLYERGRVSHVRGANLTKLEEWLTTWEPSPRAQSPDAIDALVQGIVELAGLSAVGRVRRRGEGVAGLLQRGPANDNASVPMAAAAGGGLSALLGSGEWSGGI